MFLLIFEREKKKTERDVRVMLSPICTPTRNRTPNIGLVYRTYFKQLSYPARARKEMF